MGCWSVCFLSSNLLAAGYEDGCLKVWNLDDGIIQNQSKPHSGAISSMCMVDFPAPNKSQLCTASFDGCISVFAVDSEAGSLTLKSVVKEDHQDAIHCIVSSSSGMVASGGGETDQNCKDSDRQIPHCSGVRSDKAIRLFKALCD